MANHSIRWAHQDVASRRSMNLSICLFSVAVTLGCLPTTLLYIVDLKPFQQELEKYTDAAKECRVLNAEIFETQYEPPKGCAGVDVKVLLEWHCRPSEEACNGFALVEGFGLWCPKGNLKGSVELLQRDDFINSTLTCFPAKDSSNEALIARSSLESRVGKSKSVLMGFIWVLIGLLLGSLSSFSFYLCRTKILIPKQASNGGPTLLCTAERYCVRHPMINSKLCWKHALRNRLSKLGLGPTLLSRTGHHDGQESRQDTQAHTQATKEDINIA